MEVEIEMEMSYLQMNICSPSFGQSRSCTFKGLRITFIVKENSSYETPHEKGHIKTSDRKYPMFRIAFEELIN